MKTVDEMTYEDWMKFEPLPHWAIAHSEGYYMMKGTQLMTRDGRRCGNAHVDRIESYYYNGETKIVATCITDSGNCMSMSLSELKRCFHTPKYIMRAFNYENNRNKY